MESYMGRITFVMKVRIVIPADFLQSLISFLSNLLFISSAKNILLHRRCLPTNITVLSVCGVTFFIRFGP